MKVLLLADIHANFQALEAVLKSADSINGGYDECWVLGDVIGYGPQPNECLQAIIELGAMSVAGNHEMVATGISPLSMLNSYVRESAQRTQAQLSEDALKSLIAMPSFVERGQFTLVHGSPRDHGWDYVVTPEDAIANMDFFETPGCVHGNTHRQLVMQFDDELNLSRQDRFSADPVDLTGRRFFINPGSVGLPRDSDPRAAYGVLDTSEMTVQLARCDYDVKKTQMLLHDLGASKSLIRHIETGRGRSRRERLRTLLSLTGLSR